MSAFFLAGSHDAAALDPSLESKALVEDIPSEPLVQALENFAIQTDLQVVYLSDVVTNQNTQGAPAQLKATDALARLLDGTGLQFEFLNSRIVRVVVTNNPPDDLLVEIIVTAQAVGVPKPPHFAPASATELHAIGTANENLEHRIAHGNVLYTNQRLEQYLQEIAERLLAVDTPDVSAVHVRIMKGTEANAFMLSDGSLYVTTALLVSLYDESELAAILSRELTHYANAHVLRGLRQQKADEIAGKSALILIATALVAVAAKNHLTPTSSPITTSVSPQPAIALWASAPLSHYPRDLESEADYGGIHRVMLAGYNAGGALSAMRNLADRAPLQSERWLPLYASRAKLAERITSYRQLLAAKFGATITSGVDRHAEYQANLGELPLDQVVILLEAGALDRAETLLAAIMRSRDSGRAEFLKGEIARSRIPQTDTTLQSALAAYERAAMFPGAPASAYRQAGLLHRLRGDAAAAALAFQTYLERSPSAVDAPFVRIYLDELRAPTAPSRAAP
ncbi:MAG TPA: M48 family metalloprotease [Steroidobacteraceae bacterium]